MEASTGRARAVRCRLAEVRWISILNIGTVLMLEVELGHVLKEGKSSRVWTVATECPHPSDQKTKSIKMG